MLHEHLVERHGDTHVTLELAHLNGGVVVVEVANAHDAELEVGELVVKAGDNLAEGCSGLGAGFAHRTSHVERKDDGHRVRVLVAVATLTDFETARVERRINVTCLEGLTLHTSCTAVVRAAQRRSIALQTAV